MKVGLLLSGGKDSMYAGFLAKKEGHEISCLISIVSENKESYMFHTPSIDKVEKQAEVMGIPLIIVKTKGEKEKELVDLEKGIVEGIDKYGIEGVVTGAVGSVYQASRIQKICDKLKIECINLLWGKEQIELLQDLVRDEFEVIIVGVFAYPLDEKWLGRVIDDKYIEEVSELWEKYEVNPAGEGGEFESFVLNCPLFKKGLKVKGFKDYGEKNSWRREIEVE
ncbi:diphthine--ammonia ligase [archaeon]|jgi:diphthine-ammonia ligase|nr:diphthine--ammonia ligase [archaeon]MBT4241704.1 diphthine--ammonia ligase [archaeon]MBT4418252.1 diphthine--ammonia ligase [archaeon]